MLYQINMCSSFHRHNSLQYNTGGGVINRFGFNEMTLPCIDTHALTSKRLPPQVLKRTNHIVAPTIVRSDQSALWEGERTVNCVTCVQLIPAHGISSILFSIKFVLINLHTPVYTMLHCREDPFYI